MQLTLGSEGENYEEQTRRYSPTGLQHAVEAGKIDVTGQGRPLALCGTAVRVWGGQSWEHRVGHLPVCHLCEDKTRPEDR